MTILITGSEGLIGTALTGQLVARGRRVRGIDLRSELPHLRFDTVSYTHLDVYKRQQFFLAFSMT